MTCENEKTIEIINEFLTVILCEIIFVSLRLSISMILCVPPKNVWERPCLLSINSYVRIILVYLPSVSLFVTSSRHFSVCQ